jgi:defect-in-organelle-trafficking protein DotC
MLRFKAIKFILTSFITLTFLVSCAHPEETEKQKSQIPAFEKATEFKENQIRVNVIKDTARSTGAQAALAYNSQHINAMLDQQGTNLARVFDFQAMMLPHNVMPPVLVESKDTLNLDSDTSLRLADRIYQIITPPHFVTTVPSWRDYLWMNYKPPEPPDNSLLPKSNAERDLWNKYIMIGWNEGVQQTRDIFEINLNRLQRDYKGMILYRKLLAQNMVTQPYVSKADLGITGGGTNLRINDQVMRITATSQLKANSKVWKSRLYPVKPQFPKVKYQPKKIPKFKYGKAAKPKANKQKPVTHKKTTKQVYTYKTKPIKKPNATKTTYTYKTRPVTSTTKKTTSTKTVKNSTKINHNPYEYQDISTT